MNGTADGPSADGSPVDEEPSPPLGKQGQTCEVKRLKRIFDGDNFKTTDDISEQNPSTDKHQAFALISTQNYDNKNKPTTKTLTINSHLLLDVLASTVKYYPAHTLGFSEPFKLEEPFALLYHHYQELWERRDKSEGETRLHLDLLLGYLADQPGARAVELAEKKESLITYDLLWFIFKPGSLLYTTENGQPRLYWVQLSRYGEHWRQGPYLELKCSYQGHDGTRAGRVEQRLSIFQTQEFSGNNPRQVTKLPMYPLNYHSDPKGVEKRLSERGEKYNVFVQGPPCVRRYDGLCLRLKTPPDSSYYSDEDMFSGVWLPQMV
jgi:hypothetical protein